MLKRPKKRTVLISLAVALAIILGSLGWSIGSVLAAPGTDSVAARLAEWGRDHGLGFVVTAGENLQYWLNPPKIGGKPTGTELQDLNGQTVSPSPTPTSSQLPTPTPSQLVPIHDPIAPIVSPALNGEGTFKTVVKVNKEPVIQIAYLRPDGQHTSYLSGVAWMSGSQLKFVQHPGFSDPGHLNLWTQPSIIPEDQRSGLVATFNGGFKIKNSRGGFYADGNTAGTLVKGAASLIVYADGHSDILPWSGKKPGADIVSIRQNLTLLINHGQVTPNLDKNVLANWGWTLKNEYFVWRTGIGITASGDFVFVAGNALSIQSLANLLLRAGSVRAMELDINPEWISYMWYTPGATATSPIPHKLLDFARPADRYFQPTSRDFFAVYAK